MDSPDAEVIGLSDAWHSIVREVARAGYTISGPDELAPLAAQLRAGQQAALDAHRDETAHSARELSARIAQLHDNCGFIRRYLNRDAVQRLRWQLDALGPGDRRFEADLEQKISRIESLPDSAEMAGARAELEVIEHLRLLPDTYIVFNDVQLQVHPAISYEGVWQKSAQLDHVVLGPTGVFTIETKCWSRTTAESGRHDNPYAQADRGGHLCYVLLHRAFGHTKVRSIIAGLGSLPAAPPDTMVHVVSPRDLRAFIEGYARGTQELSAEQVQRLRPFFERRVATPLDT